MSAAWTLSKIHRQRLSDAADYLAIALVVSLPWSVSATGILAVLWLIALLPTLELDSVRRVVATAAGALPVLLVALAALGMLWAEATWSERFVGLEGYVKLAVIPLLLVHFRRSTRGPWAIYALLAACLCLLAASYITVVVPGLGPFRIKDDGIPVKDYISQSGFFTLAAFILIDVARMRWHEGRRVLAFVCMILVALFLSNIIFVVTARTAYLVIPTLILLYGFVRAGWKGGLVAFLVGVLLAVFAWSASPYLRARVQSTLTEKVMVISRGRIETSSTALRLAFWKASYEIIRTAPLFGHGTGSVPAMYKRYAAAHVGSPVKDANNPHNQTFAVAMQLGLLGTVVLYAMWLFHFLLFRGEGLIAWFGAVVVVQNFVGSLVNSHLFDFTQGWTYAVLVGVAGGMMLRQDTQIAIKTGANDKRR